MPAEVTADEHVGEWKLTITADTPEEVFAAAARAVSEQCGPTSPNAGGWEQIEVEARDAATLLVDWLNELLGRSEINNRAYRDVRALRIVDGRLEGQVRGYVALEFCSPVKAATYHGLELRMEGGRWRAVVLFDV